ncbi:MAG: CPBP family intramembrane metalloprotease [Rikenellaceae bacterium]|nr:CPBP family intramembrane metalloprotease [Rikenellaceae bacterium]MCL2692134.1 CPBP family intramembrane metalloprotease [Rikenellaceae bacterium]
MKDENNEVAVVEEPIIEIVEDKPEKHEKHEAPNPPAHRPLWMDLLLIVGLYIGVQIVFGLLSGLLVSLLDGDPVRGGFLAVLATYAVVIPAAIWVMRQRGVERRSMFSFSFKKADPLMIVWGFLLLVVMNVVIEPLISMFPTTLLEETYGAILGGGGLALLSTVLLIPIAEEMLFRGVIQGGVSKEYGPIRAILIAAAIFGIVHIVPQQVVAAFLAGIVLGYIYYRTGSLVPVIVIHALNNAVGYIALRMAPGAAGESMRTVIGSNFLYWLIWTVCLVVFLFAMFKLWQQLARVDEKR